MSNKTMPTEAELRFYYFGLYAVLRRYRAMTILGWVIALLGLASVPLSWHLGTPHGLVDTLLSLGTVVAGLAVVQQSVTALASYLHVPFGERQEDRPERNPTIRYIEDLMRDIDGGGWQDAYSAIEKLEQLRDSHGLPPLTAS
jgi:hypothetical protein